MGHLLDGEPVDSLDKWIATGVGGRGLEAAQQFGPEATREEVLAAGLRGRGGGGFLTGRKWQGVVAQPGTKRYAVANGAEGEPATFKDRTLMRHNPYQLLEGLMIAAFAVGATEAYVAVKASFAREADAVTRAAQEMQAAGFGPEITISVVRGPDEYLFGEEKAMLEVIEGKSPLPRLYSPHEHGLFAAGPQSGWEASAAEGSDRPRPYGEGSNPTAVNNVETLSHVAHILARGAEWFRSMGTDKSPGTVVSTVVGDVVRPGVEEMPMGTPLSEVIDRVGGGVAPGRSVKAVFSGVANPVLTVAALGTPLDYEAMAAAGGGLGAAGFVVLDDTACMVEVARQFSRFLYVESCGQCPPCKRGSGEITERLARIESGAGTQQDIEEIEGWLRKVTDGNRCYLAVEEQVMVASILREFPEEFEEHLSSGRCPRPREIPLPKIVDLADGKVTYDARQYLKQPDWTYLSP